MKIARLIYGEQVYYANIIDNDTNAQLIEGDIFGGEAHSHLTQTIVPLADCTLLAPVQPRHVYAIGLNYAAHVDEFAHIDHTRIVPTEPICFMVPASAVVGPLAPIVLTHADHHIDYEAELVVVIGKYGKNISEADALDYVFGYTCGNDVSDRHHQNSDKQWLRAKGQPSYKPLGPWVVTDITDPQVLSVRSFLNNTPRQDGNTKDMIFSVARLIAHISAFTPLYPGDVIYSGTPEGVGHLATGDRIAIDIQDIGRLENPVVLKQ